MTFYNQKIDEECIRLSEDDDSESNYDDENDSDFEDHIEGLKLLLNYYKLILKLI